MSSRKDPTKDKGGDRVVDDLLERADAYREKFKSMKKKNEELLKKLEKLVSPAEEKKMFIPGVKPNRQRLQPKSASPQRAKKGSPKTKSSKAKKASPKGTSPKAKKSSPKGKSPKAKTNQKGSEGRSKPNDVAKSADAKKKQSPTPKQKQVKAKKESKNQETDKKSQKVSGRRGRGRRGRGRGRGRGRYAKPKSSEIQPKQEAEDLKSEKKASKPRSRAPPGFEGKPRTPRRGQRGLILAAFEPGFYGTPEKASRSPRTNPRARSPGRSYSRRRQQEELRDLYNMEKEHEILEEYNKPEFQNAFFPHSYPADPFGVAHQYPCYAGMAPGNLLPHFRRDTIFDHFEEIRKQIFQTFKEKLLVHAEESSIKNTKAENTLQVHLKHKISYQNLVPCLTELEKKITGVFVGKYDDAVGQPGCQIYLRFKSKAEASKAMKIVGEKYDIHCRFLDQIQS